MTAQAKAIELFDKDGDLSVILKLHIKRFAVEKGIEIHDVIDLFRKHEVPKKWMCFVSLNGYEPTKHILDTLRRCEP